MFYLRAALTLIVACAVVGCGGRSGGEEVVVYCGVPEPYAKPVFEDFERQTGIHVGVRYDIEASKSVGLAGKLEAERGRPGADVWWGSEAFLSVRLADEGLLSAYRPPTAADVPAQFKDGDGFWTGVGLRARVLAAGEGANAPPFEVKGIEDLADPRLKDKVAMSRPTAGVTGAHWAALYAAWGPEKARAFCRRLRANGVTLLGGNAEVADQVGNGVYRLGLTDSDAAANTKLNGGRLSMIVPDVGGEGTLAIPTTVALIKGAKHDAAAKRLIDFLASARTEKQLIALHFARWGVRGSAAGGSIKAMMVDYRAAARVYARAQREATAILDGREPE